MTTARKIIEGSLLDLGIRAAETAITSSEITDALEVLNDMLSEFDSTGELTGINLVDDADDDLMEPREFKSGIRALLATRLADQYEREVPKAVAVKAARGYDTIISTVFNQQDFEFPDTLPRGSGNRNDSWSSDTFFSQNTKRNF